MMKEITLSVMFHNNRATKLLESLLSEFERRERIKVNLTSLTWDEAWTELVKIALYKTGPDVSEIGNTWISDFARMQAINSFTPEDVRIIGGSDQFLPALWNSGLIYGQSQVSAIPWLADTRLLFFRQDILKEANIPEDGAFESHTAMERTLTQLKEQGTKTPWVIPTGQTRMTIHHAASWIWGAGGHFLSPDGKKSLLDQPEALSGLTQYFGLARLLSSEARCLRDTESDALYWTGDAAVTLSGCWLLVEDNFPDAIRSNTSFVSPPGVPFVGGSHLVHWKHSRVKRESLALINYLNSPEVQKAYSKKMGLLPANREVLASSHYTDDLRYKRVIKRMETGRSFRSVPLWGMVEGRISAVFQSIWDDLFQYPDTNVRSVIEKRILPFSQRLNTTLQQS